MISQVEQLVSHTDGRYATDLELQFLSHYGQSYPLRLSTYLKIQAAESMIIQQVQEQMRSIDPTLLMNNNSDLSGKWKRDTIRVLRYLAVTVLLDDPNTLRERFLSWFQTIMRAFGAQRSCAMTYKIMQAVVKQYLTPEEANLLLPMLELTRIMLGVVA